ncbi:hypothetical protein GGH92_007161 [Coemansia sp. RSA 2673]|nr:hypothetical protein GGH92_007161 [Coemansia sp. RSA 2673]KAJ2469657.1 hypothetical protein GGI02_003341 [Coemansia sp. RSA 2322]KAJ2487608.1 hypothetical protein EV174_000436 [Coemansia sp. RSA 2320]
MDAEFAQAVADIAKAKESHYYYSAGLKASVVSADRTLNSCVVELTVSQSEISASGCLDEGLVATVADYWTSALITAVAGGQSALTTSLAVHALKPIAPGTVIHLRCSVTDPKLQLPHATAVFASAANNTDVYALATHTKFFKPRA